MAIQLEKSGGLMLARVTPESRETEKPKNHDELGLCLALIILLAGALLLGRHGLSWAAVSHTFKAFLTAIW